MSKTLAMLAFILGSCAGIVGCGVYAVAWGWRRDVQRHREQERIINEGNDAYARLRADPIEAAAFDAERAVWDGITVKNCRTVSPELSQQLRAAYSSHKRDWREVLAEAKRDYDTCGGLCEPITANGTLTPPYVPTTIDDLARLPKGGGCDTIDYKGYAAGMYNGVLSALPMSWPDRNGHY